MRHTDIRKVEYVLGVVFLFIAVSFGLFKIGHLFPHVKQNTLETDYVYQVINNPNVKDVFIQYSKGEATKEDVNVQLNKLKKQKIIKNYYWDWSGNTVICVFPNGLEHQFTIIQNNSEIPLG